jgi:RNA polymerase sigma-70 factor (ECF subfamily)
MLAVPVQRLAGALVDPATAEDLAQETFLRALAALPSWRGEAPVRLWLLSVCRRVCADEIRRRRRRRGYLLDVRRSVEDVTDDPALAFASYDLLKGLDADRRFAFAATQLLGLSYAEAATLCGCPVGTIRSRVARAREQLLADVRAAEAG